jgi:glutathione synthase/RimK-type ligase-like ATP-grasp enzyme
MNTDNTDFLQRVGLVTYSGLLDLKPDERALAAALAELGVAATAVAWDDPRVDWAAFTGLVVRSAWNYHERPFAFKAWLAEVEQAGVSLWNAPETIRWNMEKTYLRDLARQGVAVAPTVWLEQGETAVLADILAEQGWTEAVVKPVISASAYETWLVTELVEVTPKSVEAVTNLVEAVTEPVEVTASTGSASTLDRLTALLRQLCFDGRSGAV